MSVTNKLIVAKGQRHANMTELNHLGMNLQLEPAKIEPHINQMFSATEFYSDNALSAKLYGSEQVIPQLEWTWKLRNAQTRPLTCLGNVEPSALTKLGEKGQPSMMWLDEDWLKPGDNISPGTSATKYVIRVVDKGIPREKGFVYKVRMKNQAAFFPSNLLTLGQKFGKLFSDYEEGSGDAGSVVFGNDVMFRNSMGLLRKEYQITNFASTAVISAAIPTKHGMYKTWISYAEAEFLRQWQREKELYIWYGQSTSDLAGSTGRPVLSGTGIQQMLQDGHIHKTAQMSAKLVEEFIMDVMYGRKSIGGGQKIVAYTGLYGMLNFHRAYTDVWAKKGMTILSTNFNPIEKTNSEYHSNAYSYGYRFTKFKMFNGQELELVHCPVYDDRSIHFELDPITGYPLESQRISFLDFGDGGDGKSNLRIYKKQDGFAFNYVNGLYCPTGATPKNAAAHTGSYYTMVIEDTFGMHMDDPTRCGEIIIARG